MPFDNTPFDLTTHIANHPINDGPYLRHLQTADSFNAVQEAREKVSQAEREYDDALLFLEALTAKLKIIEHLESLR